MFEQSQLAGEDFSRRSRALAASFGMQSLVAAIALLIPLMFTDRLPRVTLWAALEPPRIGRPKPVVEKAVQSSRSVESLYSPVRVFPLPTNSRATTSSGPTILSDAGVGPIGSGFDASLVTMGGLESHLSMVADPPAAKPVAKPVEKAPAAPQRVSKGVQDAKLIHQVIPAYPPLAKAAHVSGTVKLAGVIAKDGTVERLDVISGSPLLVRAAVDAVKQWIYRPTLLSGEPVEVITEIDVNFTLSQ
ncbi:MAG TPA: energy transducer TonB [Bryobacteraceae bacterium]|nr:energy transducer TonB [Bryobacteraceae bacterium]